MKLRSYQLMSIASVIKIIQKNKQMKTKTEALQRLTAIEAETKELRKIIETADQKGPVLDRLHSFEDACRIKGVLPNDILRFPAPKNEWEEAKNAEDMLDLIVEVAVEDWEPNWEDGNEPKHYPVFKMGAGFVFSNTNYYYTIANAGLGSRLYFPTAEMAATIGKRFSHLYKLTLNKPKRK